MDRPVLIQMVARAREAADQCESLVSAQKEKIRSLRIAGEDSTGPEKDLQQFESQFDHLMSEMEKLLDELDKIVGESSF